jgi:hypothetical protein
LARSASKERAALRGSTGPPSGTANTRPWSLYAGPTSSRSSFCRTLWLPFTPSASASTMVQHERQPHPVVAASLATVEPLQIDAWSRSGEGVPLSSQFRLAPRASIGEMVRVGQEGGIHVVGPAWRMPAAPSRASSAARVVEVPGQVVTPTKRRASGAPSARRSRSICAPGTHPLAIYPLRS